jgi:hypothetical protein
MLQFMLPLLSASRRLHHSACAMLRVWVGGSQLETVKVVAACDIPDAAKASVAAIKRNFMGVLLSDDAIQNNRRISVDR